MITASQIRKLSSETMLAQLASSAAAASKIAGRNVDLVRWADSQTAAWPDAAHRARALARIAREIGQEGLVDQANRVLLNALVEARQAGRASVLEVLAIGADTIARIDRGATLVRLYQECVAVDQWLTASAMDGAAVSPGSNPDR